MARGLFSGLVMGGLLGGVGLAGLSILYPSGPIIGTTPPVAGTEAPMGSTATGEEGGVAIAELPGATTEGAAPNALGEPVDTELPSGTDPVTPIEVGDVAEALPAATQNGETGDVPSVSTGDVAPDAMAPASGPDTPSGEAAPEMGGEPTMPDAQTETGEVAAVPEGGQGVVTTPSADATPSDATPDQAGSALVEALPDGQTPPAAQPITPPATIEPETGSDTPGQAAGQIGDLAEGVTTNRLPSIGSGGDSAEEVAAEAPVDGQKALIRNAQSFENPEAQPTMAVVLMDIGPERSQLGDLKNLPFPMTFVVDASAEDAAEAIEFYRSSGAEVVVSVPFPEGATPSDVEVTLSTYAPLLENSVAMLAPRESNFQTLGPSAIQIAVVLEASGHGLISIPQGLNTGHKSAKKEGVAVGLIFRELDNDGQTGRVIRRFMDNAAFKARQNQGVIMLGHARIETIQALIEWSLGSRAKSVALAPVSVILLGN